MKNNITDISKLLKGNAAWAQHQLTHDEKYFEKLARGQQPPFLWIGCSDSRVPANEITRTSSGDMFVHRNIANLVVHTDFNLMAVLQYAVEALKVKHIIVCGHYGCGGVLAALENQGTGFINSWIQHIREVYTKYRKVLASIEDKTDRANKLVELNVQEQVQNLSRTTIVREAWKARAVAIHGWVYDLSTGKIKDMDITMQSAEDLVPVTHDSI